MTQYKYFEQEGSKYFLKSKTTLAYGLVALCFVVSLYFILGIGSDDKTGRYFGVFFLFLTLGAYLKTTKKLTIDPSAKTIVSKNHVLFPEKTYHFNDFERFHVDDHYINFIKANSQASIVFDQNGKEKSVVLMITLFTSKPAQKIINEASEIMGIESGL